MVLTRRTVLRASGVLCIGAAGCLAADQPADEPSTNRSPSSGSSTETAVLETEVDTGYDATAEWEEPPAVSYDADGRVIRVTGSFPIGNNCYDARFEEPAYDPDADELHVEVTREHDGRDVCEDLFQATSYRIVIRFDGPPPGTVVATEDGALGTESVRESPE